MFGAWREATPTLYPSPQGGGKRLRRAQLDSVFVWRFGPRIPLPLEGRGKGWGSLKRTTSPTKAQAS
ncbi:hypothetical protein GCM10016234_13940 [Tianweitania populi]|uniref:Uncharacterized protein n=1 Tax=Tianweitania populi TaxID=1607949 RepID=A0A8J3GJ88_9HYPH|nr:hypothetical protein GCM10016234_13940 [Tianweitania populi]